MKSLFPKAKSIPKEVQLDHYIDQKEYLVGGQLRRWDGASQPVLSPICFEKEGKLERLQIGNYPLLTEKEALEILDVAVKTYDNGRGAWPTASVKERIGCVATFVEYMQKKRDEVVKLIMWEIGKNKPDSEKEFDRTVQYINETIAALQDLDNVSSDLVTKDHITAQIRRSPLGIVLCMGPFNYPLNETFATLIPALIMGNVVIFKPPKFGTLLFNPLLEAFQKAFPAGVVNTIYGDGKTIVSPLMASGKVDVLAFIGTSKVADLLKKQHPKPHRLRCVLGLDAKNVGIITPSAVHDLDNVVKECVLGTLTFNGQRCTALKLLFVHKVVHAEFMKRFAEEIKKLKCGMPWEDDVKLTPLPEENKDQFLNALIDDACAKGAKVVRHADLSEGTFFYPTILVGVTDKMRIFHEEQFGPIIPIVQYEDDKEPIDAIVNSIFGQQASVFSTNALEISRFVDVLTNQVSRVNVNCQCQRGPDTFPFNGRKDSAEGTLSITDALKVFSIRSIVATKDNDDNSGLFKTILDHNFSKFLRKGSC